MLRRLALAGIFLIGLLAFAPSCSSSTATPTDFQTALGQVFTLPVGSTAEIDSESLSIKFEAVASDSRCAKGVECFQAGEAKCQLLISIMGSPAQLVVTQPGGSDNAHDYFAQYRLDFKLEPYPEAGKTIAPSDYYLVMTVTK